MSKGCIDGWMNPFWFFDVNLDLNFDTPHWDFFVYHILILKKVISAISTIAIVFEKVGLLNAIYFLIEVGFVC